ncbi:MAG: glycerophosphodiester phosphodiesterase [Caldilineales bacterium]|nr:glycerophosphodiester phosphodiesterase [Caldilineales bacterium]
MSRDIFLRLLASVVIFFLMFSLHRAITVAPRAGRPALQSAEAMLVAQGGAASLAPENTLAAFQTALDLGADVLALDVRLSADGELIVPAMRRSIAPPTALARSATDPGQIKALDAVSLHPRRRHHLSLPQQRRDAFDSGRGDGGLSQRTVTNRAGTFAASLAGPGGSPMPSSLPRPRGIGWSWAAHTRTSCAAPPPLA